MTCVQLVISVTNCKVDVGHLHLIHLSTKVKVILFCLQINTYFNNKLDRPDDRFCVLIQQSNHDQT